MINRYVLLLFACVAASSLLALGNAAAETTLDSGDIVEVSIVGFPEVHERVSVQADGAIYLSKLGAVQVAGLSPRAFQTKLKSEVAAKAYRRFTPDGQEHFVTVSPDEVVASVVEFRPIYIDGDVHKTGAYPYRIGMTLRQALALAGGDGPARETIDPTLASEIGSERAVLVRRLAANVVRAWRLRQELGTSALPDPRQALPLFAGTPGLDEFIKLEEQTLRLDQQTLEEQRSFLRTSADKIGTQIVTLTKQQADEHRGVEADQQEWDRVQALFQRGTVVAARVSDLRRALLLSSTRELQTVAQIIQLQRQKDDYAHELEKLDKEDKVKLLRNLEDTLADSHDTLTRIRAADEKLHVLGERQRLATDLLRKPTLTVFRKTKSGVTPIAATEDLGLEPGDVIEVSFAEPRG